MSKQSRLAIVEGGRSILEFPGTGDRTDPIFELIERHKAAYLAYAAPGRIYAETDEELARIAADIARKKFDDAGIALIERRPTTMQGVFALLAYIDEFNSGGIVLEETRNLPKLRRWQSAAFLWPNVDLEDYCDRDVYDDDGNTDWFPYLIMKNIHAALKRILAAERIDSKHRVGA